MVQESTMTPPVSKSHLWGVFQDQQKVTHFLETEAAFFFMLPRKLWPGFLLQDKQRKIIESQGTAGPGDVVWWLSTWLACTSTWVCSSAQKSKLKRNRTSCRAKRALKTGRELPSAELGPCCHFFPPSYFLTPVAHRRKSPALLGQPRLRTGNPTGLFCQPHKWRGRRSRSDGQKWNNVMKLAPASVNKAPIMCQPHVRLCTLGIIILMM